MSIASKQRKILAKIHEFTGSAPRTPELMGILKMITHYSKDQAHIALKDYGNRLKSFAEAIDLENPHPDLFRIFDGHLTSYDEDSFNRTACDVLRLVAEANFQLSLRVITALRDAVCNHPIAKNLRHLEHPCYNQLYVRFVKGVEARDAIRATKRSQVFGSLKDQSFWIEAPHNFDLYWRNVNRYARDIRYAKERQLYFRGFGLEEMSQAIDDSVRKMEEACAASQYYGFNQIDLTTASVILSKEAGYQFGIDMNFTPSGDIAYVYVTSDQFGDYDFTTTNILHAEGKIQYRPRICVYSSENPEGLKVSCQMKKLIEHLESFPEAGGHPLFDYYRVLLPSLDYPSENHSNFNSSSPSFRKVSGEIAEFEDWDSAQIGLGVHLVEQGIVPAILLGERDGEHYFISYWR